MAIVNIFVENDADFIRQFQYLMVRLDGSVIGPIDLTGNTMRMGLRRNAADVTEDMLLTLDNGGLTIDDPVNGKFTVLITQQQLVTQLDTGDYVHSLIRTTGSSQQLRVWSGTLTNSAGPSR